MTSTVDALRVRKILGRKEWDIPEQYGPDGWCIRSKPRGRSVIITVFEDRDNVEWIHASMTDRLQVPSYEELKLLHYAVFNDGFAYQVFAPVSDHVNIHEFALHLWGRVDGKPAIPDFVGMLQETFGTRSV